MNFWCIAAESMLLIEDSEIKGKIDSYIVILSEIFRKREAGEEVPMSEIDKIVIESRAIIEKQAGLEDYLKYN